VLIEQTSACASCNVRMACATSEMQKKIITATADGELSVGDSVVVYGEQSIGAKAVLMAFVIPLILMIAALFGFSLIISSEGLAALCALSVLIPYYLFLAGKRESIARQLRFSARRK